MSGTKIRQKIKICIVASLLIVLASCSRLSVAVRWADTFIVQAVDSKFDLNSQQKKEFSVEVQRALASVRKDRFPIWAETLEKWAASIQKSGLNETLSFEMWDFVFAEARGLMKFAEGPAFKLIDLVTEKNLGAYQKSSLKEIAEAREKLHQSQVDQRIKEQIKEQKAKIIPWIEYWHDTVTKNQEQNLEEFLRQNPFPAEMAFQHREVQLEKLGRIQSDKAAQKKWINEYLLNPEMARTQSYAKGLSDWQLKLRSWIGGFHRSLTEKQISVFANELKRRAAELRDLAASSD